VSGSYTIHKLNSDGDLLWTWRVAEEDGHINTAPSLYRGAILVLPNAEGRPTAISVNMQNGAVNWKRTFENHHIGGEASSLTIYNDTMFFGANDGGQGTSIVVAANASDGNYLWEYVAGDIMWNFAASAPGDGTLLFSSSCGVAFRISFGGQLIWKAGGSYPGEMCGCGGGALGPNGIFYSEFNRGEEQGIVSARRVEDGSLLWEEHFGQSGSQYPAVGRLGADGPLAVVIAVGDGLSVPTLPVLDAGKIASAGPLNNTVIALDAMTGETLWRFVEEPWYHPYAAGETETHGEGEGPRAFQTLREFQ